MRIAMLELTRWLGSRIVAPSTATAPASIKVLSRDRDSSATWRASTRSSLPPASSAAASIDMGVVGIGVLGGVMNNLSGDQRGNLSGASEDAESERARLVARARTMMVISALTTALAIAAVVTVIGYRVYAGGTGFGAPSNEVFALPKGARVISMASSAGRVAVMIDVDGSNELRVFDMKTLKETGRLRFSTEP
jgi:hypothetical protein